MPRCVARPSVRHRLRPHGDAGIRPRGASIREIFRLPVDRIRQGYYSDAYFVYTKHLLEAEDEHPHVTMQVFQKQDSLLGGIDEAIAMLKLCSGQRAGRRRGSPAGTSSRCTRCTRATRSRRARR